MLRFRATGLRKPALIILQPRFGKRRRTICVSRQSPIAEEVPGLHAENHKAGESSSIQTIIQGQEPESIVQSVSSDEEVGKNAARARISLVSSARHALLEGTPRSAPGGFIEI